MNYKIISFITLGALLIGAFSLWEYKKYFDFSVTFYEGKYQETLSVTPSKTPETYHNYGQASLLSFMSGDYSDPALLIQSNEYFSGSLLMQEHEDTRLMYEFTNDLLELFQEQIEEEEQESEGQQEGEQESSDGSEGEEKGQEGQEGQEGEESGQLATGQNGRESEYFLSEGESIQPLSDLEQQQLQQDIESLKQDQMRNQQFYGKQGQISPFQEAYENIFGGINRGGEKDW